MISIFLSFFLLAIYLVDDSIIMLVIALSIVFSSNILYSLSNLKARLPFLFFHISIFTLWIARVLFNIIKADQTMGNIIEYYGPNMFMLIYVTLVSLRCGFFIGERKNINIFSHNSKEVDIFTNTLIRRIALMLFWITFFFKMYTIIDRVIFVQAASYSLYFLDYEREYPSYIAILSQMNAYCFFAFLGTMPSKKQAIPIIIFYLILPAILLLAGNRNNMIIELLPIVWYIFYRERIADEEDDAWINKNIIVVMLLCFPIFIVFMQLVSYMREGLSVDNLNMFFLMYEFFDRQSGSVEHLRNIKGIIEMFPEPHWRYFFQPLVDFIKGNVLLGWLFHCEEYKQHTIESALLAYNFGASYTYIVMPHNFLAGVGMGGNYLAETYLSFGYVGVLIYNLIIGTMLGFYSSIKKIKWYIFALFYSFLGTILYLPREIAFVWLLKGFNITAIGSYLLIYILSNIIRRRR